MPSRSQRTNCIKRESFTDVSTGPELPEVVSFTARALRSVRDAGWTVTEHRTRGWAYLVMSRREQLSVYKLVGPHFDDSEHHYCGHRTMTVSRSDAGVDR